MVRFEVIEFELVCPEHGTHRTIIPVELPRPRQCVHCFHAASSRREVRRFFMEPSVEQYVTTEAYLG